MKLTGALNIKVPKISRREAVLAALLLFSCIIMLFYRFIFEPQWLVIKKLQADLQKGRQVLEQRLQQGWNDIPALNARSQEIKGRIENIYKMVPNIKNEPGLLVDFYELASLHQLHADVIEFGGLKEIEGKGYSVFKISLDINGTNDNIYSFIKSMEEYPRLNRLAEFKVSPRDSLESDCNLVFDIYVMHDVKPDPKAYPFIEGKYGWDQPYKIFDIYNQEDSSAYSSLSRKAVTEGIPVPLGKNQTQSQTQNKLPADSFKSPPATIPKKPEKKENPVNQGSHRYMNINNRLNHNGYIVPGNISYESGIIVPYNE